MVILFADTEGNSLHERRLVELAFQSWDVEKDLVNEMFCSLVKPSGWMMFPQAEAVHGISISRCYNEGRPIGEIVPSLIQAWQDADIVFFHNAPYDISSIKGELSRLNITLPDTPVHCSMKQTKDICRIPNKTGKGIKAPSLKDLHYYCFKEDVKNAHSGSWDVIALRNSIRFLVQSGKLNLQPLIFG